MCVCVCVNKNVQAPEWVARAIPGVCFALPSHNMQGPVLLYHQFSTSDQSLPLPCAEEGHLPLIVSINPYARPMCGVRTSSADSEHQPICPPKVRSKDIVR